MDDALYLMLYVIVLFTQYKWNICVYNILYLVGRQMSLIDFYNSLIIVVMRKREAKQSTPLLSFHTLLYNNII